MRAGTRWCRTRTPRSSTSAPPSRSGCCCSRAATTARPSTTPSCRASRCAGSMRAMKSGLRPAQAAPPARPAAGWRARATRSHGHQPEALDLRRRQPGDHLVVAAHELDQEPLEPGQHQIEREQDPGAKAIPPAPQQPCDQPHRERLVDGRRVYLVVGRDRAVRVRHRPRQAGGLAIVAVARELAADPADRVAERQAGAARSSSASARNPRHRAQATTAARRRSRRRTRPGPTRRTGCRTGRR